MGTAPVYLTPQTAIGDVAHLSLKVASIGVYWLWRDGGYVVGGLAAGVPTGLLDTQWAIGTTGALTVFSGLVLAGVMYKTLPSAGVVS